MGGVMEGCSSRLRVIVVLRLVGQFSCLRFPLPKILAKRCGEPFLPLLVFLSHPNHMLWSN
jgi:hypothetical protein